MHWSALRAGLGLGDAVRLTGSVSDEALAAYYATCSDVFVCASEHEGFCVPIVEAMGFGLPVVAFDAGAVPDTAGAGALVLDDKSPVALATAVHKVQVDVGLRERLVRTGRATGAASSRSERTLPLGRGDRGGNAVPGTPSTFRATYEADADRPGRAHPRLQRRHRDPRSRSVRDVLGASRLRVGHLRGTGPS